MSSMGMDKSGTFNMAATTTALVTGWVARSGYPSTVIDSNTSLKADAAAPVIIQCKVTLTAGWGSATGVQFRVLKNGVQIGTTATIPFTGTTVTFTNISTTLAVNDLIQLSYTTPFGSTGTIAAGAANTYLFYDQQATSYNIDAAQTVTATRAAVMTVTSQMAASQTETVNRSASVSLTGPLDGALTVTAGRTANLYKGQFYNADAALTVTAGRTASMLVIKKPTPLPSVFDVTDISMSVHTVDGRMVGDFPCNVVTAFNWTRELNEVSVCGFDVATEGAPELLEDLRPWVHWVTVWHDGDAVWTGPIQTIRLRRETSSISARDTSTLMWRTRVPVSRTWVDTHTEQIANDLWKSMLQLHGVRATPTVLAGAVNRTFTITAKAQQRMLHQLNDDLVKVGLNWTVVAGRAVLGDFSGDPVVQLEECDFMVELERRRDGTQTFNDVRVQGQNWAQIAKAELAGLNLQTLVAMDDMFGAANIQRAAMEYAEDSARIRDELVVPGSASLHHNAPVTMDDLVPGKTFAVHAGNISQLMKLDQVTVNGGPGSIDVQVNLVALKEQGVIAELVGGGA